MSELAAAGPAAPAVSNGAPSSNGVAPGANATATQAPGGDAANVTKPPEAGAQSASQVEKLLRKLRIGGQETEIDFASPDVAREYQTLKHNAYKQAKFQQEQAEYQRTLERLKSGDWTPLQEAGVDLKALLTRAQVEAEEMAKLTPEQQEIARLKGELQRREAETARQQEAQKKAVETQRRQAFRERTFGELMSAAKAAGFPLETKAERGAALSLAAKLHYAALKRGQPPLSPEQLGQLMEKHVYGELSHKLKAVTASPAVRQRRAAELRALHEAALSGLDGDALLDFIGPEQLKRIYAAGVARHNARHSATGTPPPQPGSTDGTGPAPTSLWEARKKYNFG